MLTKFVLRFAMVMAAASSSLCFAQTDSQARWTDSTTFKVRPEMKDEFEGYLRQLIDAYKKAGTPWLLTFDNFSGDTTEYTTVAPVIKFADLDGPTAAAKVPGQPAFEDLSRKMARCYTAQTRVYSMSRGELGIDQKDAPRTMYWVKTSNQIAAGKLGEYLTWMQNEYIPALQKAGVSQFQLSQPIFGAATNEILTMRMLKNLAEIDDGPILSKTLNEEGSRAINVKYVQLVISATTNIVEIRKDLSYLPAK
jgi:hypothetical protein